MTRIYIFIIFALALLSSYGLVAWLRLIFRFDCGVGDGYLLNNCVNARVDTLVQQLIVICVWCALWSTVLTGISCKYPLMRWTVALTYIVIVAMITGYIYQV